MPKRKYRWWATVRDALHTYPKNKDPAVSRALERLSKTAEGREAIRLLNLVYFRKSNNIGGAAALLEISGATADRRIRMAFFYVAEEKNFLRDRKTEKNRDTISLDG